MGLAARPGTTAGDYFDAQAVGCADLDTIAMAAQRPQGARKLESW